MTIPELKSKVYLLPEVAWPITKQNVANKGNRLQGSDMTSDALGWSAGPTSWHIYSKVLRETRKFSFHQ